MTLRFRLILSLVGLVAAGLLTADAATYFSLRSFLNDRVDRQLLDARVPVAMALSRGNQPFQGLRGGAYSTLPPGTFGQLRDSSGTIVDSVTFRYSDEAEPVPNLPSPLPSPSAGDSVTFSTGALEGNGRFRVLVQNVELSSHVLVIAVPLADVQQTLRRLVLVEGFVTVVVLLGLGVLAWWLVRHDLRPLDDMAAAAGRIAGGDLSERVSPAESRTEVGRLGLALNSMLGRIELAFAERTASEERLRRFLADASHELRTPLTSIRGYAEMFQRGAKDDPDDLALAMRRIEDEGERMGVMVDELLMLARLGEGREPERRPVGLAELIDDAIQDARATDPERDISLVAQPGLIVLGDELQLRQVAANLIGNAIRHTPDNTPVHVRLKKDDGEALLEVADEGPGLSPEVAARAFEPFFRADPARTRATGGAGLGLAIVAAVIEAHGGTVDVASRPNHGATFSVRLPLTDSSSASGPMPPLSVTPVA